MGIRVTITASIPTEISEMYQGQYILKQLQEKIGETMELPHPQDFDQTMDVEVTSVTTVWVGPE